MPLEHALAVAAASTVGEDRAAVLPFGDSLVVIVADGAGGVGGGAAAANLVVEHVRAAAQRARSAPAWAALLVEVDHALVSVGQSTAVVATVTATTIAGASVGDCGAWLVGAGDVEELTAAQRRKPLLGTGEAAPVPFSREWSAGTLLIATDGLLKYAPRGRVAEQARGADLRRAAAALVDLPRLRSGLLADDVAVVLVRRRDLKASR
jgi:serine/threonine protein phosphatase PrpC